MPITEDDRYLRPPEPRYEDLEAAARDYYRILGQILADEGLPPRYDVVQLPPSKFQILDVAGEPDPANFGLTYDRSLTEIAYTSYEMPHGWEEKTPIRWRLLWTPTSTDAGTVIWELDYRLWGAPGTTIPAPTTLTLTATAGGTINQLLSLEFPTLTASAMAIGGLVVLGVRRKLGTYPADAEVRMVDMLFRKTTRGSQLERTKYAVDTTGT